MKKLDKKYEGINRMMIIIKKKILEKKVMNFIFR